MVFDRLTIGHVNRARQTLEGSAGKGINVAKVVHALGAPALALSFIGGETGQRIARELQTAGVPHELVPVACPTRTCTTAIDRQGQTVTELVEEAGPATDAEWRRLREAYAIAVRKASIVVLSGSIAPGATAEFYVQCIRLARAAGAAVILDAQGETLRRSLAEAPLVVKPNRAELAATLGRDSIADSDLRGAIAQLLRAGPQWAAITMGAAGVVVSDGRAFWRAAPPAIEAINPIGSGDAFAAGLAVSLLRGESLPQAAVLAVACGASNALHPLPGRIDLAQVQQFASRIAVRPMEP